MLSGFVRSLPLAAFALAAFAAEPKTELLWPDGAPGAVGNEDADRPALTTYLPATLAGTAVVVCPGGGYRHLAMDHEGQQVAQWLNSLGIAAFVLKYRLGDRYRHPAPLQDAQRAIRMVRERAAALGVAPNRIGIMGFSAGGHLASTAATHFDAASRPDFLILGYPVVSFTTQYTHKGSRAALLGDNPDPKLVENLSNENQVTSQTPPTFLFHTNEDKGVPAENSVLFYLALRKAGVPAEIHIYERGNHGVGLAPKDPILSTWPARLADWFRTRGLLPH
ncbi:MAG: alpha/beta hydrolase [Bryobacterales bacterium]|nr:alpha/beta hydrolase [Bryobacterales bacterium]